MCLYFSCSIRYNNSKGDEPMKKWMVNALLVTFILVFVASATYLVVYFANSGKAAKEYGSLQQQKQEAVEDHKSSALLGEDFCVNGGYQNIGDNAGDRCADLDQQVTQRAGRACSGGTGDHQTAKSRGHHAQQK